MIQHSKKAINMLKKLLIFILLVFIQSTIVQPVSAKSSQSLAHDTLLQEVSAFVSAKVNPDNSKNITVKAMPMDSRIRIHDCNSELEFELTRARRFTRQFPVKATCNDPENQWKAYVQVKVYEYIKTIVTTTHVAKGEIVTKDMISTAMVDKSKVRDKSSSNIDSIAGGRAMRNIPRGYQVSNSDVCLVCKGDSVSIIASFNNLAIKTTGTALENGSIGESIQVKNNSSERIIKGVIGDLRQILVKL